MCAALVMSLAGEGLVIAEVHYGGGRHVGDVLPDDYQKGMKINVLSEPVYVVAIATVKLSVGSMLLRIAGHTSYRYLIITVMAIMGTWAISSVFVCYSPRS